MAFSVLSHVDGYGSISLNTTGADLILVFHGPYGSLGITDGNGNSGWVALTEQLESGGLRCRLNYVHNPATVGAGHTFTSPQTFAYLAAVALSGSHPTTLSVVENGTGSAVDGTSISTGSATPPEGNCLVVAAMACGVDPTASAPAGFTVLEALAGVGGTNFGGVLAYKVQGGSASAEDATFAYTPSGKAVAVIATFKSDGVGGGPSTSMPPRRAFPMSILNH